MSEDASGEILVLGIGNVLWADEGFGVRAVEAFHERFEVPPGVSVVDGGTQGVYLLDHVCAARCAIVFDTIDFGLPPGTLKVLRDDEVPVWADTKMSLHQATFQELLSLARLRGRFPASITLIGVQPQTLEDFGGSLSPCVRDRLPEALRIACDELARWGVAARQRARAPAEHERLTARALALDAYEGGRPSAEAACRTGDDRFFPAPDARENG